MSVWSKMYAGTTDFDFVGHRKRYFTASGIALAISVLALAIFGLNLGVDFVGGTVVEAPNAAGASIEDVRSALGSIGLEGARVQITGGGDGIRVQTEELDVDRTAELIEVVAGVAGVDVDEVSVEVVGPTFGDQVTQSAVRALVIFLAIIATFIAIRFEWKMAIVALAALAHDLLITSGVYALSRLEVTPATVIAILTILGYSLYDTVVVFDKVEENIEERTGKDTISGIVNLSLNQVLMRSINTSLTSLLPVGSLLFVGSFLLGAATLREFALALFVGIAAGTYSSIFIAAPLLAAWKEREPEWQKARRRADRRGAAQPRSAATRPAAAGPVPAAAKESQSTAAATTVPDEPPPSVDKPATGTLPGGATPRPPKRRRRRR